jgi:hypothetical protein
MKALKTVKFTTGWIMAHALATCFAKTNVKKGERI